MPGDVLARIFDIGEPEIIAKAERPPAGEFVADKKVETGIKAFESAIVLPKAADPAAATADAIGEIGAQTGLELAGSGREVVHRSYRDLDIIEVNGKVAARAGEFRALPHIFQPRPDPEAGALGWVGLRRAGLLGEGLGAAIGHGYAKDIHLRPHGYIRPRFAIIAKLRNAFLMQGHLVQRTFERSVSINGHAVLHGAGGQEQGDARKGEIGVFHPLKLPIAPRRENR